MTSHYYEVFDADIAGVAGVSRFILKKDNVIIDQCPIFWLFSFFSFLALLRGSEYD